MSTGKSQEQVEAYKKTLLFYLGMIAWFAIKVIGVSGKVRFFCQDETRIGLKTISGRKITAARD